MVLCIAFTASVGLSYYIYDYKTNDYKSRLSVLESDYAILQNNYEELFAEYTEMTSGKKAIIILPGLMGSVLYDNDYNIPLYFDTAEILSILLSIRSTPLEDYLYNLVDCDENGVPVKSLSACNMEMEEKYWDGMFGYYKPLRAQLTALYGEHYDVLTWQYDWRLSNTINGAKLEEFINTNGYSKVIFVAHSMGGHVVSNYLQKKSNRDKVELFIPIAVPFLGSYSAESVLFKESYALARFGLDYVDNLHLDFGPYVGNLAPVYELLPAYANQLGVDTHLIDGETVFDLYPLYSGFPQTQREEGAPKSLLQNYRSYQASMYQTIGTEKVHISRLVNTEYLVFKGIGTSIGAHYTDGRRTRIINGDGDGTVWSMSATAGLPIDSINVNVLDRVNHSDIGNKKVVDSVITIIGRYNLCYN